MLADNKDRILNSSKSKLPCKLSDSLHRSLSAYALAAGAAGVAVLACSGSAEAAPVCKNPNLTIPGTNTYALNPAGQQIAPFNIAQTFNNPSSMSFGWWNRDFLTPNSAGANAVVDKNGFPAALATGASIGPAAKFGRGKSYGLLLTYGYGPSGRGGEKHHQGNFQFGQANYFGFKFSVAGQVHYGWVRLSVTLGRGLDGKAVFTKIESYGYEASPNTAIAAGSCTASAEKSKANASSETHASDQAAGVVSGVREVAAPAALGLLALGSEGLPLWREKSLR
jgi:hypothetical protein